MENILAEQKLMLVQNILQIESKEALNQIQMFIDKFLSELKNVSRIEIENEEDEIIDNESENFDATKLNFEAWNKQFSDDKDLDEYIPEHGMTLGEFRRNIYEAEADEEISREEFFESMKQW